MKKRKGLTIGSSILFHSLQQLMAFVLTVCIMSLMIFSVAGVRVNPDAEKYKYTYYMNLFSEEKEFDDTDTFDYLLLNALQEIIRYNVAKSQLEVDGEFDGNKIIDVRAFANRKTYLVRGEENYPYFESAEWTVTDKEATKVPQSVIYENSITANYYLEDLLKWDKYGLYYEYVTMTEAEFVTWFGTEHLLQYDGILTEEEKEKMRAYTSGEWYLDNGQIILTPGAITVEVTEYDADSESYIETETSVVNYDTDYEEEPLQEDIATDASGKEEKIPEETVENYALNQVHQAFIDIMEGKNPATHIYVANDGQIMVEIAVLQERYTTTDNRSVINISHDWNEYQTLVTYVEQAVADLAYNYSEYQDFTKRYEEGATNIAYVFNMTMMGETVSVTNLEEFADMDSPEHMNHDTLDAFFKSQYGRYMIYRPQNMTYESNTGIIEEADLFSAFSNYEYAYPETAEIWLAVDTEYPVSDQFAEAAGAYEGMQPYAYLTLIVGIVAAVIWIVLFLFLSVMTGWRRKVREPEAVLKLHWFDAIYTEIALAISVILGYFAIVAVDVIADMQFRGRIVYAGNDDRMRVIFLAGAAGLLVSMLGCLCWYSFLRRIKAHTLIKGSLVYALWGGIVLRGFRTIKKLIFIIYDNSSILFRCIVLVGGMLFVNFLCGFLTYRVWRFGSGLEVLVLLLFTGLVDAIILYLWFHNHVKREEIMDGIGRIKDGELNYQVSLNGMHGENKELAEAVNSIGIGIKDAVETSMKDEKLKADLITNVSHDIKTPLTSIINYVDLLKREQIEEEPVKGYIAVLDAKSQRLKQLTDDLVEASKISSGNITLTMEKINLTELVQQALGEFSEKFEQKNLQVVTSGIEDAVYIEADSRRIWRVMENLLNNIFKYAMEGTRVYLDMLQTCGGKQVVLSLKNISAQSLNINADELTERFIRGDVSRSTEGSGLGLSIAKNLTELQNGKLEIYLDGDLFKVTLVFPVYEEK